MLVTQNFRPLAAVASGAGLEVLREHIEAGTITLAARCRRGPTRPIEPMSC